MIRPRLAVVGDYRLLPGFAELLRDIARGNVGHAAGGEADHDADRLFRIAIGGVSGRGSGQKTGQRKRGILSYSHGNSLGFGCGGTAHHG